LGSGANLGVTNLERKAAISGSVEGCDADPTWYPARGFKGAPYKIQNFHGVFLDQPGPPRRLTKWLEAWEAGHDLEDAPDDDLPE
jgi:hypothetical protein